MWRPGLIVLWSAVGAVLSSSCGPDESQQFDRSAWIADELGMDHVRCEMLDDVQGLVTIGMTASEVRQVLGEPNRSESGRLAYSLASCDNSIDVHELWVELTNDRVASTHVVVG